MNKLILEKLLHTYKLIDISDAKKVKDNGEEYYVLENFFDNFYKEWEIASHINLDGIAKLSDRALQDGTKEVQTLDYMLFYKHFKSLAHTIQQSQKFFLDVTHAEGGLSPDEMERIRPDINYHMPFNHCFLQVQMTGQHSYDDTGDPEKKTDIIINLLVREDEETDIVHADGSIEHRMFHVTCIPYIGYLNKFVFDPNIYSLKYHEDGSFTFWLQEDPDINPWAKTCDLSADETGMYTNHGLNTWVQQISNQLCTFFAMMSFPQINRQKKVKGLSPRKLESQSSYKFSDLISKPTWEHKTLVLDMYDDVATGNGKTVHREGGVRFHARRKHLRRLPSGRYTFVKATFVGTKDKGVVSKDYVVK
jgi:hypothetical protein